MAKDNMTTPKTKGMVTKESDKLVKPISDMESDLVALRKEQAFQVNRHTILKETISIMQLKESALQNLILKIYDEPIANVESMDYKDLRRYAKNNYGVIYFSQNELSKQKHTIVSDIKKRKQNAIVDANYNYLKFKAPKFDEAKFWGTK